MQLYSYIIQHKPTYLPYIHFLVAYIHTYIHTYIQTHIHTCKHTHTYMCGVLQSGDPFISLLLILAVQHPLLVAVVLTYSDQVRLTHVMLGQVRFGVTGAEVLVHDFEPEVAFDLHVLVLDALDDRPR